MARDAIEGRVADLSSFDARLRHKYTDSVHRVIALLLILPALSVLTADARRHVHLYGNHDHHEHQHGVGVHDHGAAAHDHDIAEHDGLTIHGHPDVQRHDAGFQACEPGQHALRLSVACSAAADFHVSDVGTAVSPVILACSLRAINIGMTDVRAHGPPPFLHRPFRAPPLATL